MKRWLVIAGLLVVCVPDMALASSRSPTLLQRILSVFTPRPVPHHAVAHAATQKTEAPVTPAQAAQPTQTPVPVATTVPVEAAPPVQAAQALDPPSPPARPEPISKPVQAKKAVKQTIKKTKPATVTQAAEAAHPAEVAQPVQVAKAQPVRAEPIDAVQPIPAAATEPESKPGPTLASTKTKPAKAAQPVQVAILGAPSLKAALPAETAAPIEAPRQGGEPHVPPAKQGANSGCNGGQRVVSAYYWEGSHTASGQPFNPHGLTAAHRTLPFGTHLTVSNPRTGKTVTVLINDRGPFVRGVSLDLSLGAAQAIGLHSTGSVCIL
jgi:rare lipoprotein A